MMTPLSSSALGAAAASAAAAAAASVVASDPYSAHWALYPRSYTVQRAPPGFSVNDIDGDLTKNAWKNVPFSEAFGDIQGSNCYNDDNDNNNDDCVSPNPNHAIALTQFQALYDDTHLYIGAMMHPSQEFATQAHFTKHNSPIFQLDSDFEVFIDVQHGGLSNHNYKELEINAINTVWNLLLDKPYSDHGHEHSGRIALPGQDDYYEVYQQKTAVQVLQGKLNDDQNHVGALWSVEMALAYTDLYNNGNQKQTTTTTTFRQQKQKLGEGVVSSSSSSPPPPPSPGTFWRINFSRVELQGDVNWTWQPQVIWDAKSQDYQGKIDMHLPDAWGYLVFADTGGGGGDNNNNSWNDNPTSIMTTSSSSTSSSSTADTLRRRDASWPLRLTAMNIYYAQRAYRERHGKYAGCLLQLESEHLVDPNIVAPFIVTITIHSNEDENNNNNKNGGDSSSLYTAKIQCKHDEGKMTVEEETTRTATTTFTAAGFLKESNNNNNNINSINNDNPLYATVTQERLLQVVWSHSSSSRGGGGSSSSIDHL